MIPKPTIDRLCLVLRFLESLIDEGIATVNSGQLAQAVGGTPHSVRKDFCYLPQTPVRNRGYAVEPLAELLRETLGVGLERKACVIGLGRIGMAILEYGAFLQRGYRIVAGFEANVNKVETLQTSARLYPSYEIEEVVRRERIELGVIAVPGAVAQSVCDRLVAGGIRGVVSFAPVAISVPDEVAFRRVDLVHDLDVLVAQLSCRHLDKAGSTAGKRREKGNV